MRRFLHGMWSLSALVYFRHGEYHIFFEMTAGSARIAKLLIMWLTECANVLYIESGSSWKRVRLEVQRQVACCMPVRQSLSLSDEGKRCGSQYSIGGIIKSIRIVARTTGRRGCSNKQWV